MCVELSISAPRICLGFIYLFILPSLIEKVSPNNYWEKNPFKIDLNLHVKMF